jgi:hypothetical protein
VIKRLSSVTPLIDFAFITPTVLFPLILIREFNADPSIVRSLSIIKVDESVIISPESDEAKLIVPPEQTSAIA